MDKTVVEHRIPVYFYFLAGRAKPTREQARLFRKTEWVGGSLDGLALHVPNMVDWSRSEVDLSPLVPWLGNPDADWVRKLKNVLVAKWPELEDQLEVIRLEVEVIGSGYKWGDLLPIRAVK